MEDGILQKRRECGSNRRTPDRETRTLCARPRCLIEKGRKIEILIAYLCLLSHIKKMTYESRPTFRVFTVLLLWLRLSELPLLLLRLRLSELPLLNPRATCRLLRGLASSRALLLVLDRLRDWGRVLRAIGLHPARGPSSAAVRPPSSSSTSPPRRPPASCSPGAASTPAPAAPGSPQPSSATGPSGHGEPSSP